MKHQPLQTIFDVYTEGAGPSSTHSIGPQRAARHFLRSLPAAPARVRVTLYGSLSTVRTRRSRTPTR